MGEDNSRSIKEERAVRILEAAAKLIAHYGYDKTTMSDIAREAGVSKGALYLHWDSKEDLFEALYAFEAQRYLDDFVQMFDTEIGDWSFVRMFQVTFTLLQKHPFMLALMTRDQRVMGSLLRRRPDLMQQKGANNAELYRQLQKVGAARDDIEPEVIAYLLSAFSYGLLNVHEVIASEDTPSFDAIINGMGKLLDRGLEPEGGGNREAARELVLKMVEATQMQQSTQVASEEQHD